MKLSELRTIYNFCQEHNVDFRELVEEIQVSNNDFEINNFRFILEDEIDSIQVDELESDSYTLGSFNDWFIADNTDLSFDIVQALQKGEQFSELGQHIIDNDYTQELQSEYARSDGYGHHFSHYDGNTHEDLLSLGYYAFKVN